MRNVFTECCFPVLLVYASFYLLVRSLLCSYSIGSMGTDPYGQYFLPPRLTPLSQLPPVTLNSELQ